MMQINPFSFTAPKFFKKGVIVTPQYANLIKWLNGNFINYDSTTEINNALIGSNSFKLKGPSVVAVADAERPVGSFNGTDVVVFSQVPSCIYDTINSISFEANLTPEGTGGGDWIWNAFNNSFTEMMLLRWNTTQQLQILRVSSTYGNTTKTFGVWDGTGEVRLDFNGTNVACFVNGEQLGTTQAFVDRSLLVVTQFRIGWGGSPEAITGQLWNFKCGTLNVPLNEGTGTTIKDISGVQVATLADNTPTGFWANGIQHSINPNPTGDATLTSLGFTNTYMTKVSLSALNNGTTIFVSDVSATNFRILIYSSQPNATGLAKALKYVGR